VNQRIYCETSISGLFVGLVAALVGCNGPAHREVYQQKMASEIRTLEDQLYEADYQNRVLHDQLERCKVRAETRRSVRSAPGTPRTAPRRPESDAPAPAIADPNADPEADVIDLEDGFGSGDLDLPSVDPGEPVEPEAWGDPKPEMLPAPGLPQPPGKEDLEIPPIDPGEILPPPADGAGDQSRPGQVDLPKSLQAGAGQPDRLLIHPSLSSGVDGEGRQLEMSLVVQVADAQGRIIDWEKFDINGELSVVLLDPLQTAATARIGRWDFDSSQMAEMVERVPVSSIRIPLQWVGDRPMGDHVVVHVRLRGEEDEMRCQQRLQVQRQKRIADWTPRGDDARR